MELLRIDVVNKKRVDDLDHLSDLHDELTNLTKDLGEIKST